jgi:hypothetical protein
LTYTITENGGEEIAPLRGGGDDLWHVKVILPPWIPSRPQAWLTTTLTLLRRMIHLVYSMVKIGEGDLSGAAEKVPDTLSRGAASAKTFPREVFGVKSEEGWRGRKRGRVGVSRRGVQTEKYWGRKTPNRPFGN